MKWIEGGVVAPIGFTTYGTASGIKKEGLDLGIIYSKTPCSYGGVFTRNIVKAAPVTWNMKRLKEQSKIKAVIINSGNANACTGDVGQEHACESAEHISQHLKISTDEILLASTGIIGLPLPIDKLKSGIDNIIPLLERSKHSADLCAKAIMTTDTYDKQVAVTFMLQGTPVTIGGMAKGSGMIHPNMGTMLSFITTDALIDEVLLQEIVKYCVDDTYNMISVDGDTSTNDMVIALANGCAGNSAIEKGSQEFELFKEAMFLLNEHLAKKIAADGEGATKLIEIQVDGLGEKDEARKMVHALISSNLVKTAFYGEDPNWGRILCAMGYSGASFDPAKVDLTFKTSTRWVQLMQNGEPFHFDEEEISKLLGEEKITVIANCYNGDASAIGWGCDLSHEYIKINGSYRT